RLNKRGERRSFSRNAPHRGQYWCIETASSSPGRLFALAGRGRFAAALLFFRSYMPFPAIHPALDRALVNKGYAEPTPVQAAVLDGHGEADMLVSAQTGSGKTVAFGLAAATTLL